MNKQVVKVVQQGRTAPIIQLHSPGGANVHPHLIDGSRGPHGQNQMASRLVQPFLHVSPYAQHTDTDTERHTDTERATSVEKECTYAVRPKIKQLLTLPTPFLVAVFRLNPGSAASPPLVLENSCCCYYYYTRLMASFP